MRGRALAFPRIAIPSPGCLAVCWAHRPALADVRDATQGWGQEKASAGPGGRLAATVRKQIQLWGCNLEIYLKWYLKGLEIQEQAKVIPKKKKKKAEVSSYYETR